MSFTPLHLGPALTLGIPTRKWINLPTFLIANIIIDMEPFLVLTIGIRGYPLHGIFHTYLSAIIMGCILGYILYLLRKPLNPLWRIFRLENKPQNRIINYLLGGILGISLHILLDSPLYTDIKPFYPININPLYNPSLAASIYTLSIILGITGIISYILMIKRYSNE